MTSFLAEVTLRKPYKVFRDDGEFEVRREKAPDRTYTTHVKGSHVKLISSRLAGKRVVSEDVLDELRRFSDEDEVPGGYHARFYSDKVLVVLIALGRAVKFKRGRRLYYEIKP